MSRTVFSSKWTAYFGFLESAAGQWAVRTPMALCLPYADLVTATAFSVVRMDIVRDRDGYCGFQKTIPMCSGHLMF